jgi:hypothetical protein
MTDGTALKPWFRITPLLNHHGGKLVFLHTGLARINDCCHLLTSFCIRLPTFDHFYRRGTSRFGET